MLRVFFPDESKGYESEEFKNSIIIKDEEISRQVSLSRWLLTKWVSTYWLYCHLGFKEGTTNKIKRKSRDKFLALSYEMFFKYFDVIKTYTNNPSDLDRIKQALLTNRKDDFIQYALEIEKTSPQNFFQICKELAEAGELLFMNRLGMIYLHGIVNDKGKTIIPINKKKAFEWLNKVNKLDKCSPNLINLATCYFNGHGTELDYAKALNYFKEALRGPKELSHQIVYLFLGHMYICGLGVTRKNAEGRKYLLKLDQQTGQTLYLLGLSWAETDKAKAEKYFSQSRALNYEFPKIGNIPKEFDSDPDLREIKEARKDPYQKAFTVKKAKFPKWKKKYFLLLEQAALQGNRAAQYELSICLSKGIGTEVKLNDAEKWLAAAAANGHRRAIFYSRLSYVRSLGRSLYVSVRTLCGKRAPAAIQQSSVQTEEVVQEFKKLNETIVESTNELQDESVSSDDSNVDPVVYHDVTVEEKQESEIEIKTVTIEKNVTLPPVSLDQPKALRLKKLPRKKNKKDLILDVLKAIENNFDSKSDKKSLLLEIKAVIKKSETLSESAKNKIQQLLKNKASLFCNFLFELYEDEKINFFKTIIPGFLQTITQLAVDEDTSVLIDWVKKAIINHSFSSVYAVLANYSEFEKLFSEKNELTDSEWHAFFSTLQRSYIVNKYELKVEEGVIQAQLKPLLYSLHELVKIKKTKLIAVEVRGLEESKEEDVANLEQNEKQDNFVYSIRDEFAFFQMMREQSRKDEAKRLEVRQAKKAAEAVEKKQNEEVLLSDSPLPSPVSSVGEDESDQFESDPDRDRNEESLTESLKVHTLDLVKWNLELDAKTNLPNLFAKYLVVSSTDQAPTIIKLTDKAKQVLSKLKKAGGALTFGVGGLVRDVLLGRTLYRVYKQKKECDIDVVSELYSAQVCETFDHPIAKYKAKEVANGVVIIPDTNIYKEHDPDAIIDTIQIKHSTYFQKNWQGKYIYEDPLRADFLSRDLTINGFYCDEMGHVFASVEALEALAKKEIEIVDKKEFLKLEAKARGLEFDEKSYVEKSSEQIAYEIDIRIFLRAILAASYGDLHFGKKFLNSISIGLDLLACNLADNLKAKQINTLLQEKVFKHQYNSALTRFDLFTQNGVNQILFPGLVEVLEKDSLDVRLKQILFNESQLERIYAGFLVLLNKAEFQALSEKQLKDDKMLLSLILEKMKNQPLIKIHFEFYLAKPKSVFYKPLTELVREFICNFKSPVLVFVPIKEGTNSLQAHSHFSAPRSKQHFKGRGFVREEGLAEQLRFKVAKV